MASLLVKASTVVANKVLNPEGRELSFELEQRITRPQFITKYCFTGLKQKLCTRRELCRNKAANFRGFFSNRICTFRWKQWSVEVVQHLAKSILFPWNIFTIKPFYLADPSVCEVEGQTMFLYKR